MTSTLCRILLILVLFLISTISIVAQDPTIPPSKAEDTVARLALDTSKITKGVSPLAVTYEEKDDSIFYRIKDPFVTGEKWLPKSTVEALRTYYLLDEILKEKINKGQMLFLKDVVTQLLKELENNWAKQKITANQAEAIQKLEMSYITSLKNIHFQVIAHAESVNTALIFPFNEADIIAFNKRTFKITIITNPSNGRVWLVEETDFRLAKRYNVDPPWREVGGLADLSGLYRYKIEWSNGQREISTAPFKIERDGFLTLPGAVVTPNE